MMFTGTSQQQDTRFSDKEKKLLKEMKFGDSLNKRVDMTKVKLEVLRPWINKRITEILKMEDDVVTEFVFNQLEENKFPCPKKMQINMTGFLNGPNARVFMGELWALLLAAQSSKNGIPPNFVDEKKHEILRREEPPKIPKDYRPNAISSNREQRFERRSNVDHLIETNSGSDTSNANIRDNRSISNHLVTSNNTTENEKCGSPNKLKLRFDAGNMKPPARDGSDDDNKKLTVRSASDIGSNSHRKLSTSSLSAKERNKEEKRGSTAQKAISTLSGSINSPKGLDRRGRSKERKSERHQRSRSNSPYNRHRSRQRLASHYKENRSRSRASKTRERRRSSYTRDQPKSSRRSSPSNKRHRSHSRRPNRSSRSGSRHKCHSKRRRRSSSTQKAISVKQNGSDKHHLTKSENDHRHHSAMENNKSLHRRSRKRSVDRKSSHYRRSRSRSRRSPKARMRTPRPSSISSESTRNDNMNYRQHGEENNRQRKRHSSSYASQLSSGNENGRGNSGGKRMDYFNRQRFNSRERRCARNDFDDGRNMRARSRSNNDHQRKTHRRQSIIDNQSGNMTHFHSIDSRHHRSNSRSHHPHDHHDYNSHNIQSQHTYHGSRRSKQIPLPHDYYHRRSVSQGESDPTVRINSPIRNRRLSASKTRGHSSLERQSMHKHNYSRRPPSPPRVREKSTVSRRDELNDANRFSVREDGSNLKIFQPPEPKENRKISEHNSDTAKHFHDMRGGKVEHRRGSVSAATVRDVSKNSTQLHSSHRLHERDRQPEINTTNKDEKNATALNKKTGETVHHVNEDNHKENDREKKIISPYRFCTVVNAGGSKYRCRISELSLSEATAVTEAASASLAATLKAALASSSSSSITPSKRSKTSEADVEAEKPQPPGKSVPTGMLPPPPKPTVDNALMGQRDAPYRYNRLTSSLSRTPSPFLKLPSTSEKLAKQLSKTCAKDSRGVKKRTWADSRKSTDCSETDSSADDDDDNDESDNSEYESDDSEHSALAKLCKKKSGNRKYKLKSSDEGSSSDDAGHNDRKRRLQQRHNIKMKYVETGNKLISKKNPATNINVELTRTSSNNFVRKCKRDRSCDASVKTAAIMATGLTKKRMRNDSGADDILEQKILKDKYAVRESDRSESDGRYARLKQKFLDKNALKYRHYRSTSYDSAKHERLPAALRIKNVADKRVKNLSSENHSVSSRKKYKLSPKGMNSKEYDTDDDEIKKKKHKSNKKYKKHKKHKRHSSKKKTRKLRKYKEARHSPIRTSSSDPEEQNDIVAIDDNSSTASIGINTTTKSDTKRPVSSSSRSTSSLHSTRGNSINEELEKRLRERALRSMKKK